MKQKFVGDAAVSRVVASGGLFVVLAEW